MATHRNGTSSQSLEMANSNQELVSRAGARRWRCLGIVLGLALGLGVVVAILVVVLSGGGGDTPVSDKNTISLDDILGHKFAPRPFNATWVSDSQLFFDDPTGQPVLYDVVTKNRTSPFKTEAALEQLTFQTQLSADKKYVLEAFNYKSLFRHSYAASYNAIDVATGKKYVLTIPGRPEPALAQLVVWAPQGSGIAMVVNNNIYYTADPSTPFEAVTNTGLPETIYNGVPDWVYEEEVLSSNKALWFSPDGKRLLYATYNDTLTAYMTLPYYGRPGSLLFQYTRAISIRYPKVGQADAVTSIKPGTSNPTVTLSVRDLASRRTILMQEPPGLRGRTAVDTPVLAVSHWVDDAPAHKVLMIWMNRVQNHAIAQMCSVESDPPVCREIFDHTEKEGWVDLFEEAVADKRGGARILLPRSHKVGNDSFRHVARFDPDGAGGGYKRTDLTDGTFVVSTILSWDSARGYVYFVSTSPSDPGSALVQRVRDSVEGAPHQPECLTCALPEPDCRYSTASISANNSHVALTCSGPGVPFTVILDTTSKNVTTLADWERNALIRGELSSKVLPVKKRMTAPLPDGLKAQVMLWLPPNADLSGRKKYPMLVDVYGGPNSARVSERFAMDWGTYLSANQSVVYVAIDGRGSGNKGDKTTFSIYRKFGTVEVEDQIAVTKYLQDTLPYVDNTRTAIWGWSYGGYASAMALAKDTKGVFKCGMSVAPVTDWIYYDSIYTERYMGLPTPGDNQFGYAKAQLNDKVENLRNKLFLLIHGTLDDNVHYQQSMMLSRVLEENDILFRQQSYPDEEHGLVNLQRHLYHTLQNFLSECFET